MAERWYATDGTSQFSGEQRQRENPDDRLMGEALKIWAQQKDPEGRRPVEAYILFSFEDGFSAQYLGPEPLDGAELVRRVVYIADAMREASGG